MTIEQPLNDCFIFQHFEKQNQNMDFPKLLKWAGLQNNRFANPNTATGERGSYIPAETLNALVEENINAITALGGTPTENTNNQLATLLQKGSPHEAGLILRSPDLYGHRAGEYSIDVHTSAAELLSPNSSQHKQAIKNYVLPSEFNDVPFFLLTDTHPQLLKFYVGNLNNIVDSNETATLRLYCFYSCPSTKAASLVLKNKTGAALSGASVHQQLLYTQNGRDFYKGTAIYKCPTSASRANDLSLEITMPSSRTDPDFVTSVSVEIVPTGTQADDRFINGGVLAALNDADLTSNKNFKTTTGVDIGSYISAKSGTISNQNRTIKKHLTEICDSGNSTINNSFSGMKNYVDDEFDKTMNNMSIQNQARINKGANGILKQFYINNNQYFFIHAGGQNATNNYSANYSWIKLQDSTGSVLVTGVSFHEKYGHDFWAISWAGKGGGTYKVVLSLAGVTEGFYTLLTWY